MFKIFCFLTIFYIFVENNAHLLIWARSVYVKFGALNTLLQKITVIGCVFDVCHRENYHLRLNQTDHTKNKHTEHWG